MRAALTLGLLAAACGGPADGQAPLTPLPPPTVAQVTPPALGALASAAAPSPPLPSGTPAKSAKQ